MIATALESRLYGNHEGYQTFSSSLPISLVHRAGSENMFPSSVRRILWLISVILGLWAFSCVASHSRCFQKLAALDLRRWTLQVAQTSFFWVTPTRSSKPRTRDPKSWQGFRFFGGLRSACARSRVNGALRLFRASDVPPYTNSP